jgi:uncharacterized protein (DUF1697 family)
MTAHRAFPQSAINSAAAFNIAFLKEPPGKGQVSRLMVLKTDIDGFVVNNREIYWPCLKEQSESTFSNVVLEKALGVKSTLRGANTAKKWPKNIPSQWANDVPDDWIINGISGADKTS